MSDLEIRGRWTAMAGVHPGDQRLAARTGERLSALPGRWRWAIERSLRWWFAELEGMAGRLRRKTRGAVLRIADDDILELQATMTPETTGLASERAAVLIAERTPFAPADVLAGYRLEAAGRAVTLRVRLTPLARLGGTTPGEVDRVRLGEAAGDAMEVAVRAPAEWLPPARGAERAAARRRRRMVGGAIVVAFAIMLLVPIATRRHALANERAQLEESRRVLQPMLRRASRARAARDAAAEAVRLQRRAPSVVTLLDRLSRATDDDSYLTRLRFSDREATISGVSASASALPGLIEADPAFSAVRLSAPVSRDAVDGRQRFEISLIVDAR